MCRRLSGRLHRRGGTDPRHRSGGVHRLRRVRARVPGGGDLPGGRAPRQVGAVREDQLRIRRRARRGQPTHERVRNRAQRAEPAARVVTPPPRPGITGANETKGVTMPQKAWSAKRERQYEHIKDSLEDRGTSEDKAEEIAARTVNKERARKGEAKTSSRLSRTDISSGRRGGLRSGTRRSKGRTRDQLYEEAKKMGIEGRSKMTKDQLQRAVDRRK